MEDFNRDSLEMDKAIVMGTKSMLVGGALLCVGSFTDRFIWRGRLRDGNSHRLFQRGVIYSMLGCGVIMFASSFYPIFCDIRRFFRGM